MRVSRARAFAIRDVHQSVHLHLIGGEFRSAREPREPPVERPARSRRRFDIHPREERRNEKRRLSAETHAAGTSRTRARAQTPKHTPPRDVSRVIASTLPAMEAGRVDGPFPRLMHSRDSRGRPFPRSLLSRSRIVHSPSMANARIFLRRNIGSSPARVRRGPPAASRVAPRVVATAAASAHRSASPRTPLVRISRARTLGPLLRPRQQPPERLPRSVPVRAASHGAPRRRRGRRQYRAGRRRKRGATNVRTRMVAHRVTRDEFERRPRECRRVRSISPPRNTRPARPTRGRGRRRLRRRPGRRGALVAWMFVFLRGALRRGDARRPPRRGEASRRCARGEGTPTRRPPSARGFDAARCDRFRREGARGFSARIVVPSRPSDESPPRIAFVLLVVRASIDGGKRREFARGVGDGVERLQFLPGVAPPGRERLLRQRGARYPGRGRRQRRQRASSPTPRAVPNQAWAGARARARTRARTPRRSILRARRESEPRRRARRPRRRRRDRRRISTRRIRLRRASAEALDAHR